MTRRARSAISSDKMSRLAALAQLRAQTLDQRLAPELGRIAAIKARIEDLAERRAALLSSQSFPPELAECTDDAGLHAYMHATADALRQHQAGLYRDLARAEAGAAPLRKETGRAHAQVAALERMAARGARRMP